MKFLFAVLTVAMSFSPPLLAEDLCADYYKNNKRTLLQNKFAVSDGFVYAVGIAKKIGSDDVSLELAEADFFSQLLYLKKRDFENLCYDVGITGNLVSNLFQNWLELCERKYVAKNRIELDAFVKGRYAYYVAAYKLSDIEFADKTPVTWDRIYRDFKNNPDKRDELLFYEIIPKNELSAWKDVLERNITKQCGRIFALFFVGKEVSSANWQKAGSTKEIPDTYTVSTDLKTLLMVANLVPQNEKIWSLLSEKFEKMQMPRCAARMRAACAVAAQKAEEKNNEALPRSAEQPEKKEEE